MTDMSKAEVHILDNEAESKAYIEQAWAEAMVLYRQGNVFLGFTKEIEEEAKRLQKEFMPEDTNAGIIQHFLMTTMTIMYVQEFCSMKRYIEPEK